MTPQVSPFLTRPLRSEAEVAARRLMTLLQRQENEHKSNIDECEKAIDAFLASPSWS